MNQVGNSQTIYDAFTAKNDIFTESERIKSYLERGLPFEKRDATREDIVRRALGGYVVRLEINGKALAHQPGDIAHAVLVSGFNDEKIRLETPMEFMV